MPNGQGAGDPLDAVLARQALHDLNALYGRSLDRCDLPLLTSLFHPDATASFGILETTAAQFCPSVLDVMGGLRRTAHSLANEWFDVRGDHAAGEYYLFSAFSYEEAGNGVEGFVGGRYAAQFERRAGVWKYAHLMLVIDWNMNNPSTAQWHLRFGVRGDRKPADLLYSGLFQ